MSEEHMNKKNVIAILRLGNTQVAMEWVGESLMRRPVARLAKIVDAAVLEKDPDARTRWEMQEVIALRDVLNQVIDQAYRLQTLVPAEALAPCTACGSTDTHPYAYDGGICQVYRTEEEA